MGAWLQRSVRAGMAFSRCFMQSWMSQRSALRGCSSWDGLFPLFYAVLDVSEVGLEGCHQHEQGQAGSLVKQGLLPDTRKSGSWMPSCHPEGPLVALSMGLPWRPASGPLGFAKLLRGGGPPGVEG